MGFNAGLSSESKSDDHTMSGAPNSKQIRGNRNVYTESGSITVGERGQYNEQGSINLSGANDTKLNTGFDFTGVQGNITINDTGGETAIQMLERISAANKSQLDAILDTQNKSNQETQSTVSQLLNKVTDTAQTTTTGASPTLLLYLGLGLLAVVAFAFARR